MKKVLSLLLAMAMVFSLVACGGGNSNSDTGQKDGVVEKEESPSGGVDVDKGLFDVTVTIPKSFVDEDITQESLDESAKESGWKSATLNDDGSVTYVMTKAQHEEMMSGVKEGVDESLKDMVGSEDYPNFTAVDANSDYTEFTVKTSKDDLDLSESFSVLVFYMVGGMYNAFNGTPADNISVKFVNESTGEVISEANSKDMGNNVEENPSNQTAGDFDEESVISQLQVEELSYSSDFWNYAFLVVSNNSEYDLSLSVNANFYDADGNLVGAKSAGEDAVEHGQTILLYFMPDEEYASMDYEFDVEEETWYDCVLSDLSYEATPAKDKVILSVTNNGEEAAEFVQANVLFFNGDQLVGFSNNYIVDDDSELKPGKTINKEMECYEAFDSYRVYFSGRR